MRARRILIVCEPGLLVQGLRHLLQADDRLEMTTLGGNKDRLDELVREIRPDVLLLEGQELKVWLGEPPHAIRIDDIPLVVSLADNENRMRVLRVEERAVTALQELIETLVTVERAGP